jgi:hypothetical protein
MANADDIRYSGGFVFDEMILRYFQVKGCFPFT